ncbi:MAG: NAD-dependent epimerase/dehydratase family protein [Candidatus Omnitrophota bacterium]
MKYFVTGGCGFVGSSLVDRLVTKGAVTVYDNLSSGKKDFIKEHLGKKRFKFIKADLLNIAALKRAMRGSEAVFHMAANPEIMIGASSPKVDFEQGVVATYNVLEAMRSCGIKRIVFASSSTVFGESALRPTPENYGPMKPISIYGASKMSCEGLISAYCHMFDMRAWIFRFANIVGKRGTHGILVDLIARLRKDTKKLKVLGNGRQRKSYLLVEDCVDGMLFGFKHAKGPLNIFNLGTKDDIKVSAIARILLKRLDLPGTEIFYAGGNRGWPGDVPLMLLDTSKMKRLGWRVRYNSKEAIEKAIDSLIEEKRIV